jgi:hypothetical protein
LVLEVTLFYSRASKSESRGMEDRWPYRAVSAASPSSVERETDMSAAYMSGHFDTAALG